MMILCSTYDLILMWTPNKLMMVLTVLVDGGGWLIMQ